MITITTFDPTLQDAVVDHILHIENNEFGFGLSLDDQPDLMNIQSSYLNSGGQFWVALDESRVVGTAALYNLGNGDLDLRKMFVAKDFRGGQPSLAQRLLDEMTRWARGRNYKRIFLETSSKFAAAIRFYERNGFVEIGAQDFPADFPVIRVAEHFFMRNLGL
jgi:GNAT superfamily N-acetyltransferase